MVDALVLEASTSVCGFESHLPHQIKTASLFDWLFLFGGACGRVIRYALCMAGTCGSPTHAPLFFVIPYSLRSKLTAPTTDRGLEPNSAPGFFLPQICAAPPGEIQIDRPSRTRAAERHTKALHFSLSSIHSPSPALPLFPSGTDRETKIYFVFGYLTHNSTRCNIDLNLTTEGKEYGKTGSA